MMIKSTAIFDDPKSMSVFEAYANYQTICFFTVLFSYCLFAFTFVVFCSSIANIRKRNEQLEFMVEQFTNKN